MPKIQQLTTMRKAWKADVASSSPHGHRAPIDRSAMGRSVRCIALGAATLFEERVRKVRIASASMVDRSHPPRAAEHRRRWVTLHFP